MTKYVSNVKILNKCQNTCQMSNEYFNNTSTMKETMKPTYPIAASETTCR